MADEQSVAPDSTAVRVALWRALHVQVDPPPHVLEDEVGLRLAAPDENWRQRPDMDPDGTRWFRAGIVARGRGARVTILERDPEPSLGSADEAFATWDRKGAAQVRHSHAFLGRLRNLLRERYPALLDALLAAGARELKMIDNKKYLSLETKIQEIGLVGDGAGVDAKRHQRIPRVETVDGHGNSAPGAAVHLAQVLADHHRQFFGCFHFFCWSRGRQAVVFLRIRRGRNVCRIAFHTVGPHR